MDRNLPAVLLTLILSVVGTVFAQTGTPTRAGTSIENQASITYADPSGQLQVVFSNLAHSLVEQVYALSIKPDAGNAPGASTNFALPPDPSNDQSALAGTTVNLAYTVMNTGNGSDQVTLRVRQANSDAFDLENIRVYRDTNANGLLDPGEPEITSSLNLSAGERLNLIVAGQVPVATASGSVGLIDLEGLSTGGVVDNNNLSRVTVVLDAIPTLTKQASEPDANNRIRYTLEGGNLGNRAARSVPGVAVVDGVLLDGVLIADQIPSGTNLDLGVPVEAVSGVAGPRVIYHVGNDWTATPNANASRIGLLIPDAQPTTFTAQDMLAPGTAYRLGFSVRVGNLPGGTAIANTATLRYRNQSDTDRTVTSNTTLTVIPAQAGVMVGPAGQAVGVASGSYSFTDPVTNLHWAVERSGDGSNATDQQFIASSGAARTVSFKNTVRNTGNSRDTVFIGVDFTDARHKLPAGAGLQVLAADGISPVNLLTLEPGQETDVIVRISLPTNILSAQSIDLVLRVRSGIDPTRSDISRDLVGLVPPSLAVYEVWIGPQGQPTAPEYPNLADAQSRVGFEGTIVRFPHTVRNAGNVGDTLNVGLESGLPAGWVVRWLRPDGQVLTDTDGDGLPDTGLLGAGADMDVILEVTPAAGVSGDNAGAGWRLVSRVTSSGQPSALNRTLDTITRLRPAAEAWTLTKAVSSARVMQGVVLEYAFTLTNTSGQDQTNVVLNDVLHTNLGAPSNITSGVVQDAVQPSAHQVSVGFDASNNTLTWSIPFLPAGARLVLAFRARVLEGTPDATRIENLGRVSSLEIPTEVHSNTVQTDVIGAVLQLEKLALQPTVSVGSAVEFELRARNASTNAVLDNVVIKDTMPHGLLYVSGSSRLAGVGVPDPVITVVNGVQVLTWALGKLASGKLEAGSSLSLRFKALATPNIAERLVNLAVATGQTGTGLQVIVTSNTATVAVRRAEGVFTQRGTILGRVYFDTDEDGRFTPGRDEPLPGARVYVSSGRFAITDREGRYSFGELEPGSYVLRLDPLTVPFTPRIVPEDLGRPGVRLVQVQGPGLSSADFPLENPVAAATKSRSTTLRRGSISLTKTIQSGGAGFIVMLRLRLETRVVSLIITDPLPNRDPNAERQGFEAHNLANQPIKLELNRESIRFGLLEPGEYLVRYALLTILPPEFALTDPDLDWDTPVDGVQR
jgi:uncharacterized repeat protein (TIGR01451 family)